MNKFPSPLRYPGGKSCIFPFFSRLLEENNLIGISYAEPYAGGCGLALRLLFEEYVEKIHINDLDRSIYSFWKTILNFPDEFCDWVSEVDITVENWKKYKQIHSAPGEASEFSLAKATFFLNRTNVSGVIFSGGVIGGYLQTGAYKIDARFNKTDLIEKIQNIAKFKKRITITNKDGISFIKSLDRRRQETLVYLDPPYYQKGADLYMNFYSHQDHKRLSKYIHKMKNKWIVSYDNHEFILDLYADKARVQYRLSQNASNRVGDEILIFNDSLKYKDSITRLNSPILLPT